MASGPELSVVCKSCGSEVSPYVTECPYCGTRLRKRAPKLERVGDEVRVHEGRRGRLAERAGRVGDLARRPVVSIGGLAASAALFIAYTATRLDLAPTELG